MKSMIGLLLMVSASGAWAKAYPLDKNFTDRCDRLPHPVSHLVIPGGVTCVTEQAGTVYVTTGGNSGAATMALGLELCKLDGTLDLPKLKYACRNNQ